MFLFFVWLISRYYVYWLKCPGFSSSVCPGLDHIPRTLSTVPLPELLCMGEPCWKGHSWDWCWDGARGARCLIESQNTRLEATARVIWSNLGKSRVWTRWPSTLSSPCGSCIQRVTFSVYWCTPFL